MRISRYPSISEEQFLGCTAAFVDSLAGELHSGAIALRRLEGRRKGAAFAHEIALDTHRYGALIVLDRWGSLVRTFGPHLTLSRWPEILTDGTARIASAEELLIRTNRVIDSAEAYTSDLVQAVLLAFQSVQAAFESEKDAADRMATLGPLLPSEYQESRSIFLEDLAAR